MPHHWDICHLFFFPTRSDADLLEIQEYQNSDIWSGNFCHSWKDLAMNSQAAYWQILLLPCGKTPSFTRLDRCWKPFWVKPVVMSWKSRLALHIGAFIHSHSGAWVSSQDDHGVHLYVFTMKGDDKWIFWTKWDESVQGVEETCLKIKSRYVDIRGRYSLQLFHFK